MKYTEGLAEDLAGFSAFFREKRRRLPSVGKMPGVRLTPLPLAASRRDPGPIKRKGPRARAAGLEGVSRERFMFMHDEIEVLSPDLPRGRFRSALFDFDGTLSLIREGWPQVMIPMMVGVLRETGTTETELELAAAVEEFVMRLNGRQTIYQMIHLAEEVARRGGRPLDPLEYKHRYHDLLMERIHGRLTALEAGAAKGDWTVPGAHAFLEALRRRGLTLYLASGTDLKYVRREAELLGVAEYFGEHIYGALDDYRQFSKQLIIDRILRDNDLHGEELLGFGDGFVEIEEVKRVGGVAVAVASDEVNRRGVNEWKRRRLIRAGADVVIPDYRRHERLLQYLFTK
jgi:phosphoglycolate phosphatase-like HAD superfamily hydrolase